MRGAVEDAREADNKERNGLVDRKQDTKGMDEGKRKNETKG